MAPRANERDRPRDPPAREDRARDRGRAISEKNRELVNLRSFFLEPTLQRVYHVVFAETLHTIKNARGRAAEANGVRINVAVRHSIGSLDFLNLSPPHPDRSRTGVDSPLAKTHIGICGRAKNDLSTDVDKAVRNWKNDRLDLTGGGRLFQPVVIDSREGDIWKACGRGRRIGYATHLGK